MQHLPPIQIVQRGLRSKICTQCHQRPPRSEELDSKIPRVCESRCPIFLNLATLLDIDGQIVSMRLQPYQEAVERCVCEHCDLANPVGEFCTKGFTRSCPLSRYLGDILAIVSDVNGARSSLDA